MTLVRRWLPSPNYSSRGGKPVRLVVLHTAEGSRTIDSLAGWFANPANEVSSHVGIDDNILSVIGEFVSRPWSAWTQGSANPYSVAAELCAFAAWDGAEWSRHPAMLATAAAWVAEECAAFDIPIMALSAAQAQDGHTRGVCQHVDLGAAGGGHWDCGPNFPLAQVLDMARGGAPAPAPKKGPTVWLLKDQDSGGYWELGEDGGVFGYDGAPYLGGVNNPKYNAAGWLPAGLAEFSDRSGEGYCVTLDAGSAGGDRFRRYRFPRDGSARV